MQVNIRQALITGESMVIMDEITAGDYSKDNRTDLNCQTLFAATEH